MSTTDPKTISGYTEMQEEPDDHLLMYIAFKEEDEERADAAFLVFYERHAKYLYNILYNSVLEISRDGRRDLEDLVVDTFLMAYEKAETFNPPQTSDDEELRRVTRGWLGVIAKNMLKTKLLTSPKLALQSDEQWEQLGLKESPEEQGVEEAESEEMKLIQDALEALTEKERIVIHTTMLFFRAEQDHQRLPNNVVTELSDMLDINPPYIRKLRQRGRQKIEDYIEAHRKS